MAEIGDLINLVVHIERHNFKRRISEVIGLSGFDHQRNTYDLKLLYKASNLIATRTFRKFPKGFAPFVKLNGW